MLRCYIDEDYLINFEPDILSYKNRNAEDLTAYRNAAVTSVFADLNKKSEDSRYIMPELVLRSAGTSSSSSETGTAILETINRNRIVITVSVFTGGSDKVISLYGSKDNSTFELIENYTITETGLYTYTFDYVYNYYRVDMTQADGTINFKCFLVESVFDNMFAYKWLELIFANQRKEEIYLNISQSYRKLYELLLQTTFICQDKNLDGYPEINGL